MRLCNSDLQQTFLPVNSFDDVLEHLKGKCKLNLDRSINIIEPVMKAVKKHGMEDQILMKSDPSDQSLKLIEAYAPTIDHRILTFGKFGRRRRCVTEIRNT